MIHKKPITKSGLFVLIALCVFFLTGCHGRWILAYTGTTEQQDAAMMADLAIEYPQMAFTCTGHPEPAIHDVAAADGTEFSAWTAPGARGKFQITTHYLDEWLADNGYFSYLEENLLRRGLALEYRYYNHYDHFSPQFGDLTDTEVLGEAIAFLNDSKEQFDSLMADFVPLAGLESPPPYDFFAYYTIGDEKASKTCYIGPLPDNVMWGADFAYDEYERYFDYELYGTPEHVIEKNGLYDALATWYGERFDETQFDMGFHFVSDKVSAFTGTAMAELDWVVNRIDEETVLVVCGGYELCLKHGGMADDGYFWIRYISDKDGNKLHDWEAK